MRPPGRQKRELPSVRHCSATHPLPRCRLLTVIAISNPAGALCASERRVVSSPPLSRPASHPPANTPLPPFRLPSPPPNTSTRANGERDDRNGHLLGEKRARSKLAGYNGSDYPSRFSLPSRPPPDIEIPNLFRVITWKDAGYAFSPRNVAHACRRGEKLSLPREYGRVCVTWLNAVRLLAQVGNWKECGSDWPDSRSISPS